MANKLPKEISKVVKERIFARADEVEYACQSRKENGAFLDSLTNDPEIGGVLREHMPQNAVRTYIKDGVLNAYAKEAVRKKLNKVSFDSVIQRTFGVDAYFVGSIKGAHIYRDQDNHVYLLHSGTYLKWETALRKLLECVASNPHLGNNSKEVHLCLVLAVSNGEMSLGDKEQIQNALEYIGVRVYFVR